MESETIREASGQIRFGKSQLLIPPSKGSRSFHILLLTVERVVYTSMDFIIPKPCKMGGVVHRSLVRKGRLIDV